MSLTPAMLLALALQAAPGAGGASPLAPAFGATLASTYPDGRVSKLWLNADGTFSGMNRKGQLNAGRWTLAKQRLCLKQYKPFFYPFSYCTPLPDPAAAAGGWPAKAPTGEPITVRMVRGRAGAPAG